MSGVDEQLELGDRSKDATEANEVDEGETSFIDDDRRDPNTSIAIMPTTGQPVEDEDEDEEATNEQVDSLFKRLSTFNRSEMKRVIKERKEVLSGLGVNIDQTQGEGFADSKFILDNTRVRPSKKTGKPIGLIFNDVQITAFKKGKIEYSKDQKVQARVNEFKELAKKANNEQQNTLGAMVRNMSIKENMKTGNKIEATPELIELVEMRAIGETDERIEELEDEIRDGAHRFPDGITLTDNEIREMNGAMVPKGDPDTQVTALKELAKVWRDKAKIEDIVADALVDDDDDKKDAKLKASLYETQAKVCELKADNIQLRRGLRVTSQEGINIVEKIFTNNGYTLFERTRAWIKNNKFLFGGTIASILTGVIGIGYMAYTNTKSATIEIAHGVKKTAKALNNMANQLASMTSSVAKIVAPIAGFLAVILGWLATGIAFLAQNLWILVVALAVWLYRQVTRQ